MVKEIRMCDRCKKEIEEKSPPEHLTVTLARLVRVSLDFCPDCEKEILKMLVENTDEESAAVGFAVFENLKKGRSKTNGLVTVTASK